jgi:hypothetical protein
MIKVEISEDAREFILNRTNAVTVKPMIMSGCFGVANVPIVFEGEPSAPENYEEVIADGIKVYISKGAIVGPDGTRIYLEGEKSVYQDLEVEGLRYEV